MKTLVLQVQNLKYLDTQFSQSQRVKFYLKLLARKHQAFSQLNLKQTELLPLIGRLEILKIKTQQQRKKQELEVLIMKKNNHSILMKLKRSLHLFLKLSQPRVSLVKCLVRHTFHNFRDNLTKKKMLDRIWSKN